MHNFSSNWEYTVLYAGLTHKIPVKYIEVWGCDTTKYDNGMKLSKVDSGLLNISFSDILSCILLPVSLDFVM